MLQKLRDLYDNDCLPNLLLYGNPSCGKTTLLEALIREYYHLKKTDPFPENNILYINNLKEQGISYYRNEMKTFCQSRCTIYGKKKMVVIDDMDTINEQNQQVFRNFMDKYKHNVNFISVCSNIQKIIESIQSRMHVLRLESMNHVKLRHIMTHILTTEKIHISSADQEYLIQISNYSARNLLNYLEKIYLFGTDRNVSISQLCVSFHDFQLFIDHCRNPTEKGLILALEWIYTVHDYGFSVLDILNYFFLFVKITTTLSEDEKYKLIPIICYYTTLFYDLHENIIELAFFTEEIKGGLSGPNR
jgi:replication-associated recombination protein RarA